MEINATYAPTESVTGVHPNVFKAVRLPCSTCRTRVVGSEEAPATPSFVTPKVNVNELAPLYSQLTLPVPQTVVFRASVKWRNSGVPIVGVTSGRFGPMMMEVKPKVGEAILHARVSSSRSACVSRCSPT